MSQIDDFIKKYDGKGIDFDGAYGAQCVDLYRQYVKEVLKYPQSPPVEGAKDIWETYLPDYYQKVENTPYGVPDKGDIVIFGTGLGKYGHVAIFIEGTTSKFTSFDQNYPTGSLCHKQGHTYKGVIGWLKPLNKEEDMPNYLETLIQEAGLDINNEAQFRTFWEKAIKFDEKTEELNNQLTTANEANLSLSSQVSQLSPKIAGLEEKVAGLEEELAKARDSKSQASWENDKLKIRVDSLEEKVQAFQENNDILAYGFFERLTSLFRRRK